MNQQPNCEIIRDLLPLYIDNACSPSSRALVEEHLASCAECRNIYDKMRTSMPDSIKQTGAKATPKQAFRSVRLHLLGIILAAAAVISCFVINIGGAWMGDPASLGSLAATLFYLLFWGVFTVLSRNYRPLTNVAFIVSLLTFISAFNGLVWRLLGEGGFFAALIAIFAAVPFYGLTAFLGWTAVYGVSAAISLFWLVYTGRNLRRLQREMQPH